jgi:hypothetical protein
MIFEPKNLIPCVTPLGGAYVLYIKCNGFLENDEFTCVLTEDGSVRHFTSDQIKVWHNETYKIKKNEQKVL